MDLQLYAFGRPVKSVRDVTLAIARREIALKMMMHLLYCNSGIYSIKVSEMRACTSAIVPLKGPDCSSFKLVSAAAK